MSAVSLLGPVSAAVPDREVGGRATGDSAVLFASMLSDQDLRLCESHFRPRGDDASSGGVTETEAETDSADPLAIVADTTAALMLQQAAQRGSSADAATTSAVGATATGDEAVAAPTLPGTDGGDRSVSPTPANPLSPTGPDTTDPTTGAAETAGAAAATGTGTPATTGNATGIGTATTIGTRALTGAGDGGSPRAAAGSDTAAMPSGPSLLSAEAAMPPAAPAGVAPSVSVTAPGGTAAAAVSTAVDAAASSADAAVDSAVLSRAAASSGTSGATDAAPDVTVERAQPSASAMPTAAPALAAVTPTTPAAAPDAAAAATRAVAAQVSPVVVSIAQRPAGTHQLTLTVNPDSLGPVTLRAHISASGDVQVELSGATEIGREALRSMLVDLRRDLAGVMPHATLNVGVGAGAESPADRGGQPGAGGAAGDPSASEREGRPRQHPESDPGRPAPGFIPTMTTAAGAGLDIFA